MIIQRDRYLKKIVSVMNNGRVKIITGIRRCGKSYLLKELFRNYLYSQNINENHVIYLALDDMQNNALLNPLVLDSYLRSLIIDKERYYIMLDEVQRVLSIVNPIFTDGKIVEAKMSDKNVINFVNVVLGLMQIENVDLYISGSNSKFLSKDIITEFRDRGDEIYVQPLSFKEYYHTFENKDKNEAFNEFMLYGGMPLVLSYEAADRKAEYLKNLYTLTYHKDVEERNKLKKMDNLETLTKVMASNVGSLTNPMTIANTFKSVYKVDMGKDTIDKYLGYLEDSFLLKKVDRIDIKGRRHIGATYKYYFVDAGLRNARLDFLHSDDGHVMENIIYNELIYRGYSVQVGVVETYSKNEEGKTIRNILEADFVASKGSKIYYIQSAYAMDSEEKREQEKKSLVSIRDSFKKIIVTRQGGPVRRDENGIVYIDIIQFLLDENSLEL